MTKLYAGLDISLETTSVCVVDTDGHVRLKAKICTDAVALVSTLTELDEPYERVGLEAGPALTPGAGSIRGSRKRSPARRRGKGQCG